MVLTPAESINYFDKVSKLTSTKHKNVILKTLHGDIYTQEKLFRFGLTDSALCRVCNQLETIQHKVYECHLAKTLWDLTLSATDKLRPTLIQAPTEDYLQRIMAGCPDTNKLIITIHAEILTRILAPVENKPPARIILQSALLLILSREKNEIERRTIQDLLTDYYAF